MGNIAKNLDSKFDLNATRNDGALGIFQRASPPHNNNNNNNNNNKISSVWGPVPGPKIKVSAAGFMRVQSWWLGGVSWQNAWKRCLRNYLMIIAVVSQFKSGIINCLCLF